LFCRQEYHFFLSLAGPIVRYINIEDQIYNRTESVEKFVSGARRFVVGLAKKVIIANNMGYVADIVFINSAVGNPALVAWLVSCKIHLTTNLFCKYALI
jgi:D-alanyl-lipoteichoic acid acyltransferase DltB (MBOAT superfamily)